MAAEPELLRDNSAASVAQGSEALGCLDRQEIMSAPKVTVLAPLGSCNSPTVTTVSCN